ncbi:MAG: DUF4190 domain-containing protein [Xanthomonadales bacterium]|nr:DUF4190 domain-containing protein [Xanthomonadales bacterium]
MSVPVKTTSTLAIISLVAGILGWTLLPLLGSVGAIITGHMARGEIRRSAGAIDGDGLAIAGLVLGWGSVIGAILSVLLVVVFFGGIAALLAWLGLSGQLG